MKIKRKEKAYISVKTSAKLVLALKIIYFKRLVLFIYAILSFSFLSADASLAEVFVGISVLFFFFILLRAENPPPPVCFLNCFIFFLMFFFFLNICANLLNKYKKIETHF